MKATDPAIWPVAEELYSRQGLSPNQIAKILKENGMEVSGVTIAKRATQYKWSKPDRYKDAAGLVGEIIQGIDPPDIEESRGSLSVVITKALALKEKILDSTQIRLDRKEIDDMYASRILANLGLNAFNIGKLLGISTEDHLAKMPNEKNVTDSQISFYMPLNGRDQKESK